MSEIHGRNHAPKFWEKSCQSIPPMPDPHSDRHCSYEMCNVDGDSVGFVAFCCASRLAPHVLRLTAYAHVKRITNRKTISAVAVVRKILGTCT